MAKMINISHPFLTVEEFQRRAGKRLGWLIHQLAGKYPQLISRCGTKRVLTAVSVAWGLSGMAKAGNVEAFAHIDEALQPQDIMGCVRQPPGGCVMVEGEPFIVSADEQPMLRFLWDGFAIFIDHEGVEVIGQVFFDLADLRQSKAYTVMRECRLEQPTDKLSTDKQPKEEHQQQPKDKQPEKEKREEEERQKTKECLEKHLSVPLSKKTNKNASKDKEDNEENEEKEEMKEGTTEKTMDFFIGYACDIDKVGDTDVNAIKEMLEAYIDSPLCHSLSTEQMLTLAKRIRGIKRLRCELKKTRTEEGKKTRDGSTVNNFYGHIGQQVLSAGMASSSIAPSAPSSDEDA